MKPIKSTVYLPVKVERHRNHHIFDLNECEGSFIQNVAEESGYFFTPEQLNEYTQEVIKQTLETGAENADLTCLKKSQYSKKARWKKVSKKEAEEGIDLFSYEVQYKPSKKSITNTFEETFEKWKV